MSRAAARREVRTLALCASVGKAYKLEQALRGRVASDRWFLVASPNRMPFGVFAMRVVAGLALAGPRCWIWVARKLWRRRLIVTHRTLDDAALVQRIGALQPDVGLHAMGVIYRRPLIDCFRLGILNAHIGLLPRYRGRSVMEWSLLNGDPTGVTAFFVDEGIDTGPMIILRREVDVRGQASVAEAKQYLFSLDGEIFAECLRLLSLRDFVPLRQEADDGIRWYVMSRLLTGVVDEILRSSAGPDSGP